MGYYTDPAMQGLVLCGQRWYAPAYERWLSRDPAGYAGGADLYAYCDGNPVRAVDPSGTDPNYEKLNSIAKTINNIIKDIAKRTGELREDNLELPERAPGDEKEPSLSRWGHRKIITEEKANLGRLRDELERGIEEAKRSCQPNKFESTFAGLNDPELLGASILIGGVAAAGAVYTGGVAVVGTGVAAIGGGIEAGAVATGAALSKLIPPASAAALTGGR